MRSTYYVCRIFKEIEEIPVIYPNWGKFEKTAVN